MVNVRDAVPADALAVADAHVRSWQVGYAGLMAQKYLDRLRPEDRARGYHFEQMDPVNGPYTLVAVDDCVVCGYVTLGRSREHDHDQFGEIWSLYVHPAHWGSGVGGALLAAACRQLHRAGYGSAYLWVLSTNVRARRFYARAGWIIEGSERTDFVGGKYISEIKYELTIEVREDSQLSP